MRLLQDLMLLACLLFTFNTANAANLASPLQELFTRLQGTLTQLTAGR